ncbi:hypothetical protein BDY21DRAFT_135406 [Lineolata rhizophorae]|uniref:Homeobox domain-containing protein n=1 Tax=Lineolata rhizophorae TaxID=578093 RepID=A0A6A6PAA7_9PEZI|nr:hypothetical protein BDY21DRAFT_135406 [Lineolata rhizophorae]
MDRFGTSAPKYAAAAGQGGDRPQPPPPPPSRPPTNNVCGEVKPRLTKEQHDILEAHFQQQQKPSTATKKGFADNLGVPLEKINNWFQNRRAKVKQDIKKQMNAFSNLYQAQQMHAYNNQQRQQLEQQQLEQQRQQQHQQVQQGRQVPVQQQQQLQQPAETCPPPDLFPPNHDLNHPIFAQDQSALHANADPNPGLVNPQDFGSQLNPIPESGDNANWVSICENLLSAGYNVSQDQFPGFDQQSIPPEFHPDAQFQAGSNLGQSSESYAGNFTTDLSNFDYSTLSMGPTGPVQGVDSQSSTVSEPAYSTGPSNSNATSASADPPSTNSVYPEWSEPKQAHMATSGQSSDTAMPTASQPQINDAFVSHDTNSIWSNGHSGQINMTFPQTQMYQLNNMSSQTMGSTNSDPPKIQFNEPDYDQPRVFPDEAFSRRGSSTSALAESVQQIDIRQSSNFKAPLAVPPSGGLAARRHKQRPAPIGGAALRSSSYSAGMPVSPGNNQTLDPGDQSLRRIRSTTTIAHSNGRIVKPGSSSAQRSPLNFSFAEAAASPKFAHYASNQAAVSSPNLPMTAQSLAPPTPLTPNGMGHFHQPQCHDMKPPQVKAEPSDNDGLGVSWPSYDVPPSGTYNNVASPPSTPAETGQVVQQTIVQPNFAYNYHYTPPQSAPPTQQTFQRVPFTQPPQSIASTQMASEYPMMPKGSSQFRRPSLPDTSNVNIVEPGMQFGVSIMPVDGQYPMEYPMQMKQEGVGVMQHQMPGAMGPTFPETQPVSTSAQPQTTAPAGEFFVHEYTPPNGGHSPTPRRPQEPQQAKSYSFLNAGPRDFENSGQTIRQ